uniref:Uncharacterized protein n=1 Tax=Leersia perrieri TaxID=77586 RepID=A0A0D9V959_9ORYZ
MATKQKGHIWITHNEYMHRSFMLNVVLTICAIMSVFCGSFIYRKDRAVGMASAAALFVGVFAYVKASTLLHWDAFPRFVIAVLDAGLLLMMGVHIIMLCILSFVPQNGAVFAILLAWAFVIVMAVLTGWILHVDRRLSAAAEFVELRDTAAWILHADGRLSAVEGDTTYVMLATT